MREREMRQRVEQFLKVRLRNMLMPATLGLGLAMSSCGSSNQPVPMYGQPFPSDVAMREDAAPVPDSQSPLDSGLGETGSGTQEAGGPVDMAQMPTDAARDVGMPGGMLYMAPVPAYMASIPVDGGSVSRLLDGGERAVSLYMALLPRSDS